MCSVPSSFKTTDADVDADTFKYLCFYTFTDLKYLKISIIPTIRRLKLKSYISIVQTKQIKYRVP